MRRAKLVEGMRVGDLEDLVLPLISVDEFESKVDPDAVVLGFYVHDKDPASDLNRFIQKSAVSMLDTEVSPAPDQHGYYLVFVEFLNNDRFGPNVEAILSEVAPLAGIEEWQMRVRKAEGSVPFTVDALVEALAVARADQDAEGDEASQDDTTDTEKSVLEFLTPSDLTSADLTEGVLCVSGVTGTFRLEVLGFGEAGAMAAEHDLLEGAISLNLRDAALCNRLALTLGEGWTANLMSGCLIIQNTAKPQVLLARHTG